MLSGNMSAIDWANGPFFIKTEADPNGGTNYTIEGVQQLLSVPYALYAGSSSNGFSGDYNDLINKPEIPTVPTNVSAFENDANYLTSYTEQQMLSISNDTIYLTGGSFVKLPAGFDGDYNSLTNRPNLFSGSYNDLTDKPTIPDVPTNVSVFNNDAGYITMDSIPEIPYVPSDVSAFNNDASYVSNSECTDVDLCTLAATLAQLQAIVEEQQNRIEELEEQIGNNPTDTTIISNDTIPAGDAQPCPGTPTVTDIDGNEYNTVQIGNQCWMKENLHTTRYANGTSIPLGSTYSYTDPYRYYPNHDQSNVSTYGYLYNWPAVMGSSFSSSANPSGVQGICPTGWHVPSDAEWTQLTDYVGSQTEYQCNSSSSNIAKALASTTGWNSNSGTNTCAVGNNPSANNATGFSAVPAGNYGDVNYNDFGDDAVFWSATKDDNNFAYFRGLYCSNANVRRYSYKENSGFSVRCVRGETSLTVTTGSVSAITSTTATVAGNVTADGNSAITACGVCYGTTANPDLTGNHLEADGTTGEFTVNLTGLTAGTTYYVRAYATNSVGTAYGSQVSFTTPYPNDGQPCPGATTVTDIDGNEYNTVQIGNQCWMKENLRTTRYANGTSIPLGSTYSNTDPYRYYPNNDQSNVSTYGYLYNWPAVMGSSFSSSANPSGVQGICPTGWHVPSDAEWTQLTDYVGSQTEYQCNSSSSNIAKALASTTGWQNSYQICAVGNNPSFNNTTGFSALPAGNYAFGSYSQFGNFATFWSATESSDDNAYGRYLDYNNASVYRGNGNKVIGFSVRCVRD